MEPKLTWPWLATPTILVTAAFLGLGAIGHAQSDLRAITYQGYLEQNGIAANGTKNLTFRLYNAATAGNQIGGPIAATVTVYSGSFATVLAPIPVEAFAGGPLFLEIDVDGTTLQGRQQVYSVPFALGTSRGDDFVVSGKLGVGGAPPSADAALIVGTGADGQGGTADTLLSKSTIEIPIGDGAAGGLLLRDPAVATARAEISFATTALQLRLLNDSRGLYIDGLGNVAIDGTLATGGNATIGGSLQTGNTGCHTDACPGVQWIDVAGGMGWGSWRGRTYCPAHKYVCGIEQRVEGDQGGGDDTAANDIAIVCCPF